ncbi:MAG TPA: GAF domain-containing sensor histidine kinase [Candidatus Angelobacter sp.]|jgi:signal transduction histidine kinase|nr:GAF domain-containing sensor histidine kinase [Candidatus Angelobacter sp.]
MSEAARPASTDGAVQRLLDAVMAISSDLSLPNVLRRIVAAACELVDARYGALGVIGPGEGGLERGLVEFITVGADEETIKKIGPYPQGRGILGLLVTDPKPLRLRNLQDDAKSWGFPPNHPPMHSFLGVPIRIRGTVFGNLYLTEKRHADEFSKEDEDLAVALASAAAVAIENARLLARVHELAIVEERERIARDLHDIVLQRLFATGLALQILESRARDDAHIATGLHQAVSDLDDTVRDIRGAIFALNAYELGERSVRVLILALAAEARGSLGFEPRVHFEGPVDAALPPALIAHLHATLREILSNVARHAGASSVDIHLTANADLALRVVDNGRGIGGDPTSGNGLRNIAARASELGGSASVAPAEGGGTRVEWRVPFQPADPTAQLMRS